jgi:ATP-dependent RNA helicase HelY
LEELGYIDKSSTTPSGKTLASVYGEKDLLIVEAMSKINWHEFNPAEFVGFLSTFLFESRGDKNENGFKIPKGKLSEAISEMVHIWAEIHQCEIDHDLEPMSEPNLGFVSAAHRWAIGHSLTSIIKGSDLTVGDFVRSMKQVLDLSRQIRAVYPGHRELIDQAILRIDRGVVSYTSGIEH